MSTLGHVLFLLRFLRDFIQSACIASFLTELRYSPAGFTGMAGTSRKGTSYADQSRTRPSWTWPSWTWRFADTAFADTAFADTPSDSSRTRPLKPAFGNIRQLATPNGVVLRC